MAERTCLQGTKTIRLSLTIRKRKGYLVFLLLCITALLFGTYIELLYIIRCFSESVKKDFQQSDVVSLNTLRHGDAVNTNQRSISSVKQFDIFGGKEKLIVWYNAARQHWNKSFTGIANCGQHRCKISQNPDHVPQADGVIVNAFYLKPNERPRNHSMKQMWIFYCKEPPSNLYSVKFPSRYWGKVFNWTLTYRADSDFVFPYGALYEKRNPVKRDWMKIAKEKSKSVAWFVGNCKTSSRREDYVRKLQSYGINIDIYGRCGKFKCPRKDERACLKDYRFYLAFENSFCSDYVTEKFFKTFEHDIIPVVRGGANYTHLFPRECVINTADFRHIRDLGSYLLRLEKNLTEYASYLQSKGRYRIGYPQPCGARRMNSPVKDLLLLPDFPCNYTFYNPTPIS
ncbi:alpha-(1,3)-fucosyltransferase C-like isoform X2 [Gigantopelta aegis]|uniref:alpha-(1,3)-fucosyltransferase C-like isoform X2 n=1 Tax=Gigantopelta aegis TaxID=1735272 RepID=UPI001B887FBC|nr:alpha-(1,3)-fucosyltransferase C-like isoform X2 [Gigantopelta aegis]